MASGHENKEQYSTYCSCNLVKVRLFLSVLHRLFKGVLHTYGGAHSSYLFRNVFLNDACVLLVLLVVVDADEKDVV